jgi:NADPH:quinone reductase
MKAIGFTTSLPIDDPASLFEFDAGTPVPGPRDLLVRVRAVSVNPVDWKQRQRAAEGTTLETPKILGYDASGAVEAVGSEVSLFAVGDEVFYAGSILRQGTNAELHLVDERLVGRKPKSLTDAEAAALPLTAITAWEAIFDRLRVPEGAEGQSILVIGGAGGVGSIAIQLARQLTRLEIIATASREESARWCRDHGADRIADHRDLVASVRAQGRQHVDYILCTNQSGPHFDAMAELIAPQGAICSIVGTERPVEISKLMGKSASFGFELMFTRSTFQTEDMIEQHRLLNRVADLVDAGRIKTTLSETLTGFTAENHRQAHKKVEAGSMIGKVAISY